MLCMENSKENSYFELGTKIVKKCESIQLKQAAEIARLCRNATQVTLIERHHIPMLEFMI